MRKLEEAFGQTEVVQDFERRRVDRVTPEITQKVGVLFQDDHLDAGASRDAM